MAAKIHVDLDETAASAFVQYRDAVRRLEALQLQVEALRRLKAAAAAQLSEAFGGRFYGQLASGVFIQRRERWRQKRAVHEREMVFELFDEDGNDGGKAA